MTNTLPRTVDAPRSEGPSRTPRGAGILCAMSRTPASFLALTAILVALAAACGGGGAKTTTRTVAVPPSTRAAVTGDGAVDQVIAAALASNEIELAGLVGYQKIACKKDSRQGPGDPPLCRENEADGTSVEVFASTGCDGTWVRPEQVPDVFRTGLPKGAKLLAVFRPKDVASRLGSSFGADYVAVFRVGTHGDGQASGAALHLKNGRIVWFEADCRNVLELIAPEKIEAFILDPAGTVTPPTPTP